jgi:hypothetical protein
MIAIDSSSFISYLSGDKGNDIEAVEFVLEQKQGVLPPVVLSELLSDPKLPTQVASLIRELPLLPILEGYWERVGVVRSQLLARGFNPRLADSLIAQICMDHKISLITRDKDFKPFAQQVGLKLFVY